MENKRKLILTSIAFIAILIAVISASFAYFSVSTDNSGNTTLNATVGNVGMVTLTGGESLTLNVTAEDMAKGNAGTTYSAKNDDNETIARVATATLVGGDIGATYQCRFSLTVENTSTMTGLLETDGGVNVNISDNTKVVEEGFVSGLNQSPEKIVSGIYEVNFGMTGTGVDQTIDLITIGADIINSETDGTQRDRLAGKNLNLNFEIEHFTCDTSALGDTTAPRITTVINNNNTDNVTISITSNEDSEYCINESSEKGNMEDCVVSGNLEKDTQITTEVLYGTKEYYIHTKDNSGNISISDIISINNTLTIGNYLLQNPTAGLSTIARSGMYRYSGNDHTIDSEGNTIENPDEVNNYVDLDGVSYRIIGIVSEDNATLGLEEGMIKVIKTETIGVQQWYTNRTTNINYESSLIYQRLNDLDSSQTNNVLGNTNIISSSWVDRISSVKWNVGDVNLDTNSTAGNTAEIVISYEDNTKTSNTSKIGLMYASDYYYAADAIGETNCYENVLCLNWLTDTANETWTMTRYGKDSRNYYLFWRIRTTGALANNNLSVENSLRPVFYLKSDVQYTGDGTGESTSPLQIA